MLREEDPGLAEEMLIGSLGFDSSTQRLQKTYAGTFGRQGTREFLDLAVWQKGAHGQEASAGIAP